VITDIPHESFEGAVTAYSIDDAIERCKDDTEVFIIGGGSIYRQFMPLADRLYITHVHKKTEADVFFPKIDKKVWEVIEKEEFTPEGDGIPYTYVIYERKR
jgi:dihydrofolate reductase